jgi:putative glutathione S-transferase
MLRMSAKTRLAGPVDLAAYGDYRIPQDDRPLLRFTGRITDDGEFTVRPRRYHVYGGWFCPWSQRVAITRDLAGLHDHVTMSYVDGKRDGRGWAFRETYGPDPVNGFTLLRQAYEATEDDFDGHVSVPALWDRVSSKVVSNDCVGIGLDLATRFGHLATPLVETYPSRLRDEIEELDSWLGPAVNHGVGAAAGGDEGARKSLLEAFELLDERLADAHYLLGDALTEADVRLWVTLVRYDVGANADRGINPGLAAYPNLWAYARDLYTIPAFATTTDFAAFTRPGAILPDWKAPAGR